MLHAFHTSHKLHDEDDDGEGDDDGEDDDDDGKGDDDDEDDKYHFVSILYPLLPIENIAATGVSYCRLITFLL